MRYVYRKAGRFEVRAEGMGNCDGVATARIQVNPAPATPSSAAPPPAVPAPGSVRDMDTDRDGVVTRAEWRGSEQAFRNHDTNGDGVLSGAEVRDEPGEVIVKAAERWTSTGVYVREGGVVRIESAGTVQLSADAADTSSPGGADPAGAPRPPRCLTVLPVDSSPGSATVPRSSSAPTRCCAPTQPVSCISASTTIISPTTAASSA